MKNKQYTVHLLGKNIHIGSYPTPAAAAPHKQVAERHRDALMQQYKSITRLLKQAVGKQPTHETNWALHKYFSFVAVATRFMRAQQRQNWPEIPTPDISALPWFPEYRPVPSNPFDHEPPTEKQRTAYITLFAKQVLVGNYQTTTQKNQLIADAQPHVDQIRNELHTNPPVDTEDFQRQAFAYLDTQRELGWTRTPTFRYQK